MKKIDLPIHVDEPNPKKPDWKWLKIMLVSVLVIISISFLWLYTFNSFLTSIISLEEEKKLFTDPNCIKLDLSKYIDYNIPEFNKYNICLKDSYEVNAYAWLWGNIYVTKWLLKNLNNQEELVFVIWHEIWHIVHRDVIKKISFGVSLQILLNYLFSNNFNSSDISDLVELWDKLYSKNIELKADTYSINLLKKYNINLNCIVPFFKEDEKFDSFVLLSDHPLNKTRIQNIEKNIKNKKKICKKIKK